MIDIRIKRSKLFNTFTPDEQKKYFDYKSHKFIHHIDTFYYNVFIKDDNKEAPPGNLIDLFNLFDELVEQIDKTGEVQWWDSSTSHVFLRCRHSCYTYCISLPNYYDVFFVKNLPNKNTPRISIQLRSVGLWELGEYTLINNSYNFVKDLLKLFGVLIDRTQENRIDYCYHTNCIQNPIDYFSDSCLANNCYTSFKIYQKVGNKNGKELTVEYLSLGQRSSNNIFFRSYNKVREVIEKGYKGFFLEFWFNSGLISYYDYWVYLYAYNKKSYNSIWKGILEFYITFGSDEGVKDLFNKHLKNDNNTYEDYKSIALKYLPIPTTVLNFEFQTMRKFYYNGDSLIDTFPIVSYLEEEQLLRLYRILDNRRIFLDYLTSNTVSFADANDSKVYLDFWKRLRSCKLDKTINVKYNRNYSKKPDMDVLFSRFLSNMATFNLYKGNFDTSIEEDFSTVLTTINDNTVIYNDGSVDMFNMKYNDLKEKKKKALASLLKNTNDLQNTKKQ